MCLGLKEAKDYLHKMRCAVGSHLIDPDSIYSGLSGHLRFARECGYALNDFGKLGQEHILHASYGEIYVIGCNLKPLLDAKEWINEMRKSIKNK